MYIKKFKQHLTENGFIPDENDIKIRTRFIFNLYFLDKRHLLRPIYEKHLNSDDNMYRASFKIQQEIYQLVKKKLIVDIKPLNETLVIDDTLYWQVLKMYFDPKLKLRRNEMDTIIYKHLLKKGKITKDSDIQKLYVELNGFIANIKTGEDIDRII